MQDRQIPLFAVASAIPLAVVVVAAASRAQSGAAAPREVVVDDCAEISQFTKQLLILIKYAAQ